MRCVLFSLKLPIVELRVAVLVIVFVVVLLVPLDLLVFLVAILCVVLCFLCFLLLAGLQHHIRVVLRSVSTFLSLRYRNAWSCKLLSFRSRM